MSKQKIHWKPGTMLYPVPAVIISCGTKPEDYNLFTVSWVGTICTNPPMVSISVRPERHSYEIIKQSREFVINIPSRRHTRAVDYCGVRTGKRENKWEACGLKPSPSKEIITPQISDVPVSLECRVKDILPLGSHDCFLAEVVNVSVLNELVDKKGYLNLKKADLISYVHGDYVSLGQTLGTFGFSIRKKK